LTRLEPLSQSEPMPKVILEKSTSLDPQTTFTKVQSMLSDDKDLRKLDSNYKCQFDAQNLSGSAKGSQFEANMSIKKTEQGSHLTLVVQLPLLLTPFKGLVEKTLSSKLEQIFS